MALAVSDRLTTLDAAARLPAETIATGRNKIFLCYLCLYLPCLANAAVSRGELRALPKHATFKGVVIAIRAVQILLFLPLKVF